MLCNMEFFVWLGGKSFARFNAASGSCYANWRAMLSYKLLRLRPAGRLCA